MLTLHALIQAFKLLKKVLNMRGIQRNDLEEQLVHISLLLFNYMEQFASCSET